MTVIYGRAGFCPLIIVHIVCDLFATMIAPYRLREPGLPPSRGLLATDER